MKAIDTTSKSQETCLLDAYEQVLADLSHVTGYPVKLSRAKRNSAPRWPSEREMDGGHVRYCLPGPGNKKTIAYLYFPDEAEKDPFAQKCIDRFTGFAERMGRAVNDVNDVKRILVKEEPLLWEDIIVAATYSDSVDKLNAMSVIAAVKDSLYLKYEGRPIKQGILMTWDLARLREVAEAQGCTLLPFSRELEYRDAMKESKSISQFSDGRNSLLVVSPEGRLKYLLRFGEIWPSGTTVEWEMVPKGYRHLKYLLFNKDLILVTTTHNELILLNNTGVLKLTGNMWHRITGTPLTYYLKTHLDEVLASRLSELIVESSAAKIGASILIAPDWTTLKDWSGKGIARDFRGSSLGNVATINRNCFQQIAGIDGCTLIEKDGTILNAGVIITIPERFTKGEEGARSAATRYGSTFGLGIKVSADGPITLYEKGVAQRNIA